MRAGRTHVYVVVLCIVGWQFGAELFAQSAGPASVTTATIYPVAVDPARIGSYPAVSSSGAGYFYDDVLEYRVWFYPPGGGDDQYRSFATFKEANAFSRSTPHAELPLVLVRQLEWINEPKTGEYVRRKGERITEWQTGWLDGGKRTATSLDEFIASGGKSRKQK